LFKVSAKQNVILGSVLEYLRIDRQVSTHQVPSSISILRNPFSMVRHAESNLKKKAKTSTAKDEKMQAALQMWALEQALPGKSRSLHRFCQQEDVRYTTMIDRLRGTKSIKEFNSQKQLLSPPKELATAEHLMAMADRALPLTRSELCDYVNEILETEGRSERVKPDGNWVTRFLARHRDQIAVHWSKPLETQRAQAANPEVINHWFHEIVAKHAVDRETGLPIAPELQYGMDESGCPPVSMGKERVIGRKGTKTQHRRGSNFRENVTVIVTICADGTTYKPTIIFKGKHLMSSWVADNVAEAR
jgi:hypothetical protein